MVRLSKQLTILQYIPVGGPYIFLPLRCSSAGSGGLNKFCKEVAEGFLFAGSASSISAFVSFLLSVLMSQNCRKLILEFGTCFPLGVEKHDLMPCAAWLPCLCSLKRPDDE